MPWSSCSESTTKKVKFKNNHYQTGKRDTVKDSIAGRGGLEEHELLKVLKASMEENGMKFDGQELEDLTHALWEDAMGEDSQGKRMTISDFKGQLKRHPGFADGLAER